jgi:hypothetical protein
MAPLRWRGRRLFNTSHRSHPELDSGSSSWTQTQGIPGGPPYGIHQIAPLVKSWQAASEVDLTTDVSRVSSLCLPLTATLFYTVCAKSLIFRIIRPQYVRLRTADKGAVASINHTVELSAACLHGSCTATVSDQYQRCRLAEAKAILTKLRRTMRAMPRLGQNIPCPSPRPLLLWDIAVLGRQTKGTTAPFLTCTVAPPAIRATRSLGFQ